MEKYNIEEDRKQLAEDILKMLERGSLNDVKIKLSDGEIVANKDILIARSDYSATMFSNNRFIEGETGSVDMRHSSKAVMEKIIVKPWPQTLSPKPLSPQPKTKGPWADTKML